MADDRRRELRRRRILENPDARRDKIFGITKSDKLKESADDKSQIPDVGATPAFATSTPLPGGVNLGSNLLQHVASTSGQAQEQQQKSQQTSSNSLSYTPLSSRENTQQSTRVNSNDLFHGINGSDANYLNDPENSPISGLENLIGSRNGVQKNKIGRNTVVTDPRLSNTDDFTLGSSFDEDCVDVPPTKLYDHPIVSCILALAVCFFLCNGLGNVVFNSLVMPFIVYEAHRVLYNAWQSRKEMSDAAGSGLVKAALLLCGIQQQTLSRFMIIATTLQTLSKDFALYLITIVMWHTVIGLPISDDIEPVSVHLSE